MPVHACHHNAMLKELKPLCKHSCAVTAAFMLHKDTASLMRHVRCAAKGAKNVGAYKGTEFHRVVKNFVSALLA